MRSGHKIGKGFCAAVLALWFAVVYPGARVVLTSSTARQVKIILWHELAHIHAKCIDLVGGHMPDQPSTGLRLDNGSEIFGFSTDQPENMAGISGAYVLYIVDEASGVDERIFEAIEGNRAGGAKLVMFSNPTKTAGTFYDAFHSKRAFWKKIHVSSEESPNCTGETQDRILGLAVPEWIEEVKRKWGVGSIIYQIRVKGNFASSDIRSVVTLDLLEASRALFDIDPLEHDFSDPLKLGLDPAYTGDTSALAITRGTLLKGFRTWHGLDPIQLASAVALCLPSLARRPTEPISINVDVGGLGQGVFAALRRAVPSHVKVYPVDGASKATSQPVDGTPGYANLRAQLWFGMREWLVEGGRIGADDLLEADLVAPIWEVDARGRILLEAKKEIKKRLGRSPDRGDALALACYHPPMGGEEFNNILARVYKERVRKERGTV